MTDHTPSGQQAVELKPCPFCGGSALIIRCPPERDGQKTLHRPQCDQCGADCGGCDTPSEAIALWNRRTTAPSTAAGEREEWLRDRLTIYRLVEGSTKKGQPVMVNEFTVQVQRGWGTTDADAEVVAERIRAALATPPAQALPSPRLVSEEDGEHEAFILRYSDTEMRDEVFAGHGARDAAFRRFEQQAIAWTCGLFQRIRRTGGGPLATDPHATPPAQSPPWQEQAARQCEEWALLLSAKGSNAAKVFDRIQFNADAVKLRDHARAFRALLSKPAKGE